MTGFDFLHDAGCPRFESLRGIRLPERHVAGAAALFAALCVLIAAAGIERMRVDDAQTLLTRAQASSDTFTKRAERGHVRALHAKDLLALARRLRSIRLSGRVSAEQMVRIAVQMPKRAWLTAVEPTLRGNELRGTAQGADVVARVLEAFSDRRFGRATLVNLHRTDRVGARPLLSFDIVLEPRS